MNIPMDLSPVEEEVEERGVVDGLDLGPGPIIPGPVTYRPLRRLRRRRERRRRGSHRREPEAEAAAREQHHGFCRSAWPAGAGTEPGLGEGYGRGRAAEFVGQQQSVRFCGALLKNGFFQVR